MQNFKRFSVFSVTSVIVFVFFQVILNSKEAGGKENLVEHLFPLLDYSSLDELGNFGQVQPSNKGFLIFYIANDCSVCMADLSRWIRFREIYTELSYTVILGSESLLERKPLVELFETIGLNRQSDSILYDDNSFVLRKYGVAKGTCMIALDENELLINVIRPDDFSSTRTQNLHRLLSRMNN